MVFEYKRSLSEAWYSNQMFWCLNLLFQVVTVSVCYNFYTNNGFMIESCSLNILLNLMLVVLMLRTERRTVRNKRPHVDQDYIGTPKSLKRFTPENRTSQMSKAFLKITFLEKSKNLGGHTYFTFISELNFADRENPRVIKTKEDFKILSKVVRD